MRQMKQERPYRLSEAEHALRSVESPPCSRTAISSVFFEQEGSKLMVGVRGRMSRAEPLNDYLRQLNFSSGTWIDTNVLGNRLCQLLF